MAEYKIVNGQFVEVPTGTGTNLTKGAISRTPQNGSFNLLGTQPQSAIPGKPYMKDTLTDPAYLNNVMQYGSGFGDPSFTGLASVQAPAARSETLTPMEIAGSGQITTFDNAGFQIDASGNIMNTPGNFDMFMNTEGASTAGQQLFTEFDQVMTNLDANPMTEAEKQAAAFRNEMKPWGKAQIGMQIASSGLEALSGLYNAYMAKKTYDLGKDSFEFNRALSLTNLENQAKLTNAEMADRQALRYSMGGASPEEYMATNAVRGRL